MNTTTNAHGFPTKPCTRCGGSGHYSFNQMDGTRCYGCNGTGFQLDGKASAAAWLDYCADLRALRNAQVGTLAAGDVVTFDVRSDGQGPRQGAARQEVASITVTPEVNGRQLVDGVMVACAYGVWLTYTDGTSRHLSTNHLCYRYGQTLDTAPYLARCKRTR